MEKTMILFQIAAIKRPHSLNTNPLDVLQGTLTIVVAPNNLPYHDRNSLP